MLLHQAEHGRQPQPGALPRGFGGKKGIEDLVYQAGFNAHARIGHRYHPIATGTRP